MKKVVVIRFSALGDCVLTLGPLQELKDAGCHVTVVTKGQFVSIFEDQPCVDDVIALNPHGRLIDLLRVAARIRDASPDIIIDLHRTLRARLLGICFIDYIVRRRWFSINKLNRARREIVQSSHKATLQPLPHITERYATPIVDALARKTRPQPMVPRYVVPSTALAASERTARVESGDTQRREVVLVPGAAWNTKCWPIEFFADLAARLVQQSWCVTIVGGRAEKKFESAFSGVDVQIFFENRPFPEVFAQLQSADLVIANDTGLLHMATAVGTPAIALMGPTSPLLGYIPLGTHDAVITRDEECSPCTTQGQAECPLGHHNCMRKLEVDTVFRKAMNILSA